MLGGLGLRGTALVSEGKPASRREHYVCLLPHGYAKRTRSSSSSVVCRSAARQGTSEEDEEAQSSSSSSSSKLMRALLKNPVAFFGGCFVGIMELDVTQDPLKGWIQERIEDMQEG